MQDSLEDYIKISKNTKPDEQIKLSKDVQLNAKIKVECDKRAMKIVEFLIEGRLRPEIFLRCLPFINQDHYQDIVEERAISKLCGYSICGKKIPEMPKQQYFISTKSNKVYDITDRKNYCSNYCYKASLHIKNQVDNSPLWLRKAEDVPEFKLMLSSEGGLPGEYIDQGISKPVLEPVFTAISSFTHASLEDMVERELNPQRANKSPNSLRKNSKLMKSTMQTISENNEPPEEEIEVEPPKKIPEKVIKLTKSDSNKQIIKTLPVIDENEERNEIKENIEDTTQKKSKKKTKTTPKLEIENHIQKSINEWLTLESYIFIFGENKIKSVLSEKKLSNIFDSLHIEELDQSHQIKYMNICKRLHLQELADEKFDNSVIGQSKLRPLPDFSRLKKESQDLDLKVKAFYSGALYEKEDPNFPNVKKTEEVEEGSPAVLPLVDVSSQNALRKKIFLNSINRAMQGLLQALRVTSYSSVLSDLQALVKTFKLNANNIVFKPILWNYISVILFNILSLRDKELKTLVEEKRSQEHFELILSSLPSKSKLLHETMANVRDIDKFIENYIVSKEL